MEQDESSVNGVDATVAMGTSPRSNLDDKRMFPLLLQLALDITTPALLLDVSTHFHGRPVHGNIV
jgi:hypothetical protein